MHNTLSRGDGGGSKRANNKALVEASAKTALIGTIARVSNPVAVLAAR